MFVSVYLVLSFLLVVLCFFFFVICVEGADVTFIYWWLLDLTWLDLTADKLVLANSSVEELQCEHKNSSVNTLIEVGLRVRSTRRAPVVAIVSLSQSSHEADARDQWTRVITVAITRETYAVQLGLSSVQCEHFHWNTRVQNWRSVQFSSSAVNAARV